MNREERLNAIWLRTVEKLKEVVREFEVTEDELHVAGDYLNRLGQSGMGRSLIDVALAMTAVDVAAERRRGGRRGTRPNLEGPYHARHPLRADGNLLEHAAAADASRLLLTGAVSDAASGAALPGARIDFWQTDSNGLYDRKGSHLRGIVVADNRGHYRLSTVLPSDYAEHDHDAIGELFRAMGKPNTRAAHLHAKVSVDGALRLTT
ncbi:MAG: dioxygenase, partial [Solimonas sp.]